MSANETARNYQMTVPGEALSLALIRLVVTHLAEVIGFTEEDVGKIEIAVDEACTNVIEHAYKDLQPKPVVRVEIQSQADQIIVDIIDHGVPFDFGSYETPRFPEHWADGHMRGVGLFLIRKCTDEAVYERLPEPANRLRLVKKLNRGT